MSYPRDRRMSFLWYSVHTVNLNAEGLPWLAVEPNHLLRRQILQRSPSSFGSVI